MKTLTLLRHAKSTWNDPVARDFDRPLNRRGRRAAETVGRELRAKNFSFDRVIASPAAPVKETLEEIAEGYGDGLDPDFDQRVYMASPACLLDIIHEVADENSTLLIVGHNPGTRSAGAFAHDR